MNRKAGNKTKKLSFIRILVTTPKNINIANPPEESRKMGVEINPIPQHLQFLRWQLVLRIFQGQNA
jgi:hypothetical protein